MDPVHLGVRSFLVMNLTLTNRSGSGTLLSGSGPVWTCVHEVQDQTAASLVYIPDLSHRNLAWKSVIKQWNEGDTKKSLQPLKEWSWGWYTGSMCLITGKILTVSADCRGIQQVNKSNLASKQVLPCGFLTCIGIAARVLLKLHTPKHRSQ